MKKILGVMILLAACDSNTEDEGAEEECVLDRSGECVEDEGESSSEESGTTEEIPECDPHLLILDFERWGPWQYDGDNPSVSVYYTFADDRPTERLVASPDIKCYPGDTIEGTDMEYIECEFKCFKNWEFIMPYVCEYIGPDENPMNQNCVNPPFSTWMDPETV